MLTDKRNNGIFNDMSRLTFLIDPGHGGMLNGKYQTDPRLNKLHRFPSGEIAYEGVSNRQIKNKVMAGLEKAGLNAIDLCPTQMDIELDERSDIANIYCREYGQDNCLLISLHSNKGQGTGFEIWNYGGKGTKSYKYCLEFIRIFKEEFSDIVIRHDWKEGDIPKEAAFYILKYPRCPVILPEFLFYDNWNDWQKIKNPGIQDRYAAMIVKFAQQVEMTPII